MSSFTSTFMCVAASLWHCESGVWMWGGISGKEGVRGCQISAASTQRDDIFRVVRCFVEVRRNPRLKGGGWRTILRKGEFKSERGEIMQNLLTTVAAAAMLLSGTALVADDWYPSKYGPDDTIGAANNLSPEKVLEAVKLVKTGKTYSLAIETGRTTPAYSPRTFELFVVQTGDPTGQPLSKSQLTVNNDLMQTWLGIGTQIDGLGHVGINHRYYNGTHASDFVDPKGLKKFGTHTIPPIVTRGVLLDMAAYFGVGMVPEGTAYNRAEIEGATERQGVTIRKGDVVIFHSGWMQLLGKENQRWVAVHPGLGAEGAQYLAHLGVVAVGADSAALEVIPYEDPEKAAPVHQTLLAKNGVYVLENIRTEELARDKAYEFLLVIGQPKFVGAVQMVINPIAIR